MGTVLTVASGGSLAWIGVPLIVNGVGHFATTYAEYTKTGDWQAASKNAGIFFSFKFDTDFGYGQDKQNGVYQDVPAVEPKTDSVGEISNDAIPCVQCHHQTVFSLNEENNFNFNDRVSGFVQYGGEMRSGFIGSSIGKNGLIYNSQDSPFALSDHTTKINFLNYLSDVMGGLGIGYNFVESLYGNENIEFRSFNYTTTDTIWSWGRNPVGTPVMQYKLKYKQNKGYIINNDTLH